ncbi:hypothetical protein E4T56_gene20774 [Termitomyces sp. T112]|nr:hypothetical protein E4T56_gene20774 [Termitomyces sp. T112]
MTFNLWHPLPILDILRKSLAFSRIRTALDKLLFPRLMMNGSLYIKRSLTTLAKSLPLRGVFRSTFRPSRCSIITKFVDLPEFIKFLGWPVALGLVLLSTLMMSSTVLTRRWMTWRNGAPISQPPNYTQAIEEGAFDEWSAADISDAAAFALSHRDMDMSLDYDSDMDMFESPAERVLIVGLLLLACAILADLEDELRQANEELYKLEEWCANLEEDNRALAGIRPPPDYTRVVEEGMFDKWSVTDVSGAFALSYQDMLPSYDTVMTRSLDTVPNPS